MKYTDNLDNYKSYPNTESCYLDGRYFNMVLDNYPGLIREPLYIFFKETDKVWENMVHMNRSPVDNNYMSLMRVIIEDGETRHSNLLIIDYKNQRIYRFEPLGLDAKYLNETNKIIEKYLGNYVDFDLYVFNTEELNEKNPNCEKGGFCTAYVIKFAYDFVNNRKYDPSDIRKFAKLVQTKYGPLPEKGKDVEFGLLTGGDVSGRNVVIGGLGGGLIGGLVTRSPGGALVGAGLGGLAGTLI